MLENRPAEQESNDLKKKKLAAWKCISNIREEEQTARATTANTRAKTHSKTPFIRFYSRDVTWGESKVDAKSPSQSSALSYGAVNAQIALVVAKHSGLLKSVILRVRENEKYLIPEANRTIKLY